MEDWKTSFWLEEGAESEESETSGSNNAVGEAQREGREKALNDKFTWGAIGVIAALIFNVGGFVWYASQLAGKVDNGEKALADINKVISLLVEAKDRQVIDTAQLSARVGAAEREQISVDNSINNLTAKAAQSDIHFQKIDDNLEGIAGNVSSLLDIAQTLQETIMGGGKASQNPNFPQQKR